MNLRTLPDRQLAAYDADFVAGKRWPALVTDLTRRYPGGRPAVLDLGGGAGLFADRLLDVFPEAHVVLVDDSELLLSRNCAHPHKTTVRASIGDLPRDVLEARFDLVCLHFVLHHLVAGSYRATRNAQVSSLRLARTLLAPGGAVSVFEDVVESRLGDAASSRSIHALSSNRPLAPLLRRLGYVPAGVGVCFLGERDWLRTFDEAGLRVTGRRRYERSLSLPRAVRLLLRAHGDVCHYWLEAEDAVASRKRRKRATSSSP